MINRVVLVGRLTRDPELRTTGSGISVATFTLAVDRQYTNAQGERGADFISCVIWRKAAENFCNFTSKGSLVGIDGRIQTRTYDNKDGQRVYVTEVVVDNFSLLESRKEREARGQNGDFTPNNTGNFGNPNTTSSPNMGASNQNNPINNQPDVTQDPFAGSGDTIDISDDDLPF
ncbi:MULTISPECIES: single-stranded DNA-binding protein [Lactobacillus]|uniref:Single-stranded DNA-binding protein n=1 Tax=Lactobacillus bombicola TaxID=1505723 RepID=A0A396SPF6_9LACO|nr:MULTISPECIES: single-stranded DNA-binding protein [Lactobacillus]RHW50344.1 single-stranded DNA-binding protein [Lactobacillus bombicola]RHW52592.1 single-stranded DNA-binding protein [Lactobacillus bombicola]RHW53783.1 single-stranded DNA-binding protein [Lactobacillus bombicola]RMC42338.1 single-stranded DNA-binding protein [Lactobacillus sp. ESL0237]RMC45673.1 single-stranded DNA-binding protein [Lactobacillus sp. ESL0234]